MPRDPEIASINASIADAKRDADNAFAAIRPLRQRRDAIKAEIGSVKARIDSLKSERAREYEAIGICRAADYPIYSGFALRSFYEAARPTFIYDLEPCDIALILTDSPDAVAASAASADLAAALLSVGCRETIVIREAQHVQHL